MTHTILIVDDELALTEVLANILEYHGYSVLTAADGIEALAIMQHNQIDLLISDYMMPRCNGIALHQRLTSDPTISRMPIIMMSALPAALRALPVHAILTKPFAIDELLDIVKGALGDPSLRISLPIM